MENNTQLIESFIYEYPINEKIVGIITEDSEGYPSFILKPDTKIYSKLNKLQS